MYAMCVYIQKCVYVHSYEHINTNIVNVLCTYTSKNK